MVIATFIWTKHNGIWRLVLEICLKTNNFPVIKCSENMLHVYKTQ